MSYEYMNEFLEANSRLERVATALERIAASLEQIAELTDDNSERQAYLMGLQRWKEGLDKHPDD